MLNRRGGETVGVILLIALIVVILVFYYYYFTWMMNAPTLLSAVKRIGFGIIMTLGSINNRSNK